jgi:hypothetical protein
VRYITFVAAMDFSPMPVSSHPAVAVRLKLQIAAYVQHLSLRTDATGLASAAYDLR